MASRNFNSLALLTFMGNEQQSWTCFGYKEQVVSRVDEGLVLLQGVLTRVPAGSENCSRSPLAHERSELPHEAFCPKLCSRLE
jgi:hypothetical protein